MVQSCRNTPQFITIYRRVPIFHCVKSDRCHCCISYTQPYSRLLLITYNYCLYYAPFSSTMILMNRTLLKQAIMAPTCGLFSCQQLPHDNLSLWYNIMEISSYDTSPYRRPTIQFLLPPAYQYPSSQQ